MKDQLTFILKIKNVYIGFYHTVKILDIKKVTLTPTIRSQQ